MHPIILEAGTLYKCEIQKTIEKIRRITEQSSIEEELAKLKSQGT
jgi:hypothetical protein